jgi:hypothetical protein
MLVSSQKVISEVKYCSLSQTLVEVSEFLWPFLRISGTDSTSQLMNKWF